MNDNLSQASVIEHIKHAQAQELESVSILDKERGELTSRCKEIESEIKFKRQRVEIYERCLEILDPAVTLEGRQMERTFKFSAED